MKKLKRLKIVEQIAIVTIVSVIVPLVIAGVIVNNINQHAIRQELSYSAMMIAQTIDNNIYSLLESDESKLNEAVLAVKYLQSDYLENAYLKDVAINSNVFQDMQIVRPSESKNDVTLNQRVIYDSDEQKLVINEKINDDKYIVALVNTDELKKRVFSNIKNDSRRIYVIDNFGNLVFAHNFSSQDFDEIKDLLPEKLQDDEAVTIGNVKNQPIVYYRTKGSKLTVIVNTTQEITETTINTARAKIIVAILVATGFILLLVGIYTYYLYINMRQLFKAVIALSKGNYKRQVRLLTNIFTPSEIVFLASEFNRMINEINVSYKKLKKKNVELKLMSDFRSNLVDTVSHEFRTPLTSIKGYTSRLLRQDIVIDDETKHKSLMIVKQQCDRLSRMVEDLLVIPDIEGAKLNIILETVNVADVVDFSLLSVKNIENREVELNIPNDFPLVFADEDRLEQVLINLIENATKYAYDNSPIKIDAIVENDRAVISVVNESDYIEKQVLEKLFEKFTRVDDEMTRTTRGTGLGLFIVKGLMQAMNGSIYLKSTTDNRFIAKVIVPLAKEDKKNG